MWCRLAPAASSLVANVPGLVRHGRAQVESQHPGVEPFVEPDVTDGICAAGVLVAAREQRHRGPLVWCWQPAVTMLVAGERLALPFLQQPVSVLGYAVKPGVVDIGVTVDRVDRRCRRQASGVTGDEQVAVRGVEDSGGEVVPGLVRM